MIAQIIIGVALLAVAYQAYETVMAYKRATGSIWERLKAAFSESATIFWSRVNSISVALTTLVATISTYLGAPGIKETITPWLTPEYLLAYTLVILIGSEIARRRTL